MTSDQKPEIVCLWAVGDSASVHKPGSPFHSQEGVVRSVRAYSDGRIGIRLVLDETAEAVGPFSDDELV